MDRPDDAPTCAICDTSKRKLIRFYLYVKRRVDGRVTTRGAGGIHLCERCWRAARLDSSLHSRQWRSAA